MQVMLDDQRQAWDMQADGTYRQRRAAPGAPDEAAAGTHQTLMEQTLRGTHRPDETPPREAAG